MHRKAFPGGRQVRGKTRIAVDRSAGQATPGRLAALVYQTVLGRPGATSPDTLTIRVMQNSRPWLAQGDRPLQGGKREIFFQAVISATCATFANPGCIIAANWFGHSRQSRTETFH
jgi:hypothetical protein